IAAVPPESEAQMLEVAAPSVQLAMPSDPPGEGGLDGTIADVPAQPLPRAGPVSCGSSVVNLTEPAIDEPGVPISPTDAIDATPSAERAVEADATALQEALAVPIPPLADAVQGDVPPIAELPAHDEVKGAAQQIRE